jgi:hypothetical protein
MVGTKSAIGTVALDLKKGFNPQISKNSSSQTNSSGYSIIVL